MELVKRASPEFKFSSDGSIVTFDIEAMSKEDRKMVLDQCRTKRKNFEKRDEDLLDRLDLEKWNKLVILRVVKGWTGLKNKHLPVIYDCKDKAAEWQFKGDGKRETEIPYTEDAKRELAEMHSANFMDWISYSIDEIEKANVQAKEAELKN
jgi:hypothetical protein